MASLQSERLRDKLQKLSAAGVQKYVGLPQIAVMGDTSSGKSSLLSAISGIQFPSSDKICTRCATQLILNEGDRFEGTARIQRFENNEDNTHELVREVKSLSDVTDAIRDFTAVLVSEGQSISDDSIVINIKGPDLPNLSLIDLPGIVRTVTDNEDYGIIEKIRSLVKRYLEQPRTIIVAVVPANVDMHNSEILQAAYVADPEGERTIAVITKPDLVDEGAEDSVINLLQNRAKKLKLGYHAVRCRGQKELNEGVSIKDALKLEEKFFHTRKPWNEVNKGLMEKRIDYYMPIVSEEIKKQLSEAQVELEKIGPGFHNETEKLLHFDDVVSNIEEYFKACIKGSYDLDNEFFKDLNMRLRAQLRKDDYEFNREVSRIKVKTKDDLKAGDKVEIIVEERIICGEVVEITNDEIEARTEDDEVRSFHKAQFRVPLEPIVEMISNLRGEELPVFPSSKVFCGLLKIEIQKWTKPMEKLRHEYDKKVRKTLLDIVKKHCYYSSQFSSNMMHLANNLIDKITKNVDLEIEKVLLKEYKPWTHNPEFIARLEALKLAELEEKLMQVFSTNVDSSIVLKALKTLGFGKLLDTDREAMDMHQTLVAYSLVAQKRFIDQINLT
ncbi:hypothetical protein ROZALSC1DRAFT_30604, partial [Rozella allomycis CSF55]